MRKSAARSSSLHHVAVGAVTVLAVGIYAFGISAMRPSGPVESLVAAAKDDSTPSGRVEKPAPRRSGRSASPPG